MPKLILSIDQGTTGTTALLIDENLKICGKGYHEFQQIYPKPGWVEHNPEHIWNSVLVAVDNAIQQSRMPATNIAGIGITNQRETNLIWNRETGKPYHNAIVWQCRRTEPIVTELKQAGHEPLFQQKTGLLLDPYFSGTKFRWQLDNVSGLRDEVVVGKAIAGTVDTFLIWKLSQGEAHVTDVSNASRTLLMDLNRLQWDEELCSLLNVPQSMLPRICSCAEIYGHTRNVPGLPDGIPICGLAGDQQAALFGQACFKEGEAKCTYGTGGFLLMNTGAVPIPSKNGLLTTVAWQVKDTTAYALEGSAFIAGSAVKWLRDGLGFITEASQVESLANQVPDSGGVMVVPAFVGLGAPHWRSQARGVITGLTLGTQREHIARATLEGIALQNVEILQAMVSDSNQALVQLKVDGGASSNNLLMQMQADFLGCRIIRPEMVETTAMGAAFLAGLGIGIWKDFDDIAAAWKKDRAFEPQMSAEDRSQVLKRWREAVQKA
jgi:glycerol kinase